ncbi:MAG: tRNA dihydrouridine synthase DusB [Thermoanaerobaculia bacterium]
MLRLGELAIAPPLVLAPMAGITDQDFRLLLRRIGGVGLVSMEFLSAKGLSLGDRRVWQCLRFHPEERPLAIQIYGSDPHTMAEAACVVEASGADVCDINMGCPANKVLAGCSGAALMGDLRLAERIVATVCRATRLPVTVKFRLGLDDLRRNYLELGRICEANGAAAVTLHGRTARQMFTGEALWEPIGRLKAALSIPVIGNGDVRSPEDALALFAATGCDAVMVGRAATANPWIFRQIADRLAGGTAAEPSLAERAELIRSHFAVVLEREAPGFALHKLRVFTRWYSYGLPGGQSLRRRLGGIDDAPTLMLAVEDFLDGLPVAHAA